MQSIPVPSIAGLGPMVHSAMNVSLTDGQKVSVTYQKNKRIALRKWQTTIATATDQKCRTCNQKQAAAQNKELSCAKFGRLIKEGLEPHPGPNIQPRKAVHFNIVTQQCRSARCMQVLATYQNCVLILQDTPFTEAEFAIFRLGAKKSQLKVLS